MEISSCEEEKRDVTVLKSEWSPSLGTNTRIHLVISDGSNTIVKTETSTRRKCHIHFKLEGLGTSVITFVSKMETSDDTLFLSRCIYLFIFFFLKNKVVQWLTLEFDCEKKRIFWKMGSRWSSIFRENCIHVHDGKFIYWICRGLTYFRFFVFSSVESAVLDIFVEFPISRPSTRGIISIFAYTFEQTSYTNALAPVTWAVNWMNKTNTDADVSTNILVRIIQQKTRKISYYKTHAQLKISLFTMNNEYLK